MTQVPGELLRLPISPWTPPSLHDLGDLEETFAIIQPHAHVTDMSLGSQQRRGSLEVTQNTSNTGKTGIPCSVLCLCFLPSLLTPIPMFSFLPSICQGHVGWVQRARTVCQSLSPCPTPLPCQRHKNGLSPCSPDPSVTSLLQTQLAFLLFEYETLKLKE